MELFWFELLAPGFICLFSLPGLQQGGFPLGGVKSQKHIWTSLQKYQVLHSAGTAYRQQRLWSHQRKKLLPKIFLLMQRRSVLGHTPSLMGSLSLSWCIKKKVILIDQMGIYFNLLPQPCRMTEKTHVRLREDASWAVRQEVQKQQLLCGLLKPCIWLRLPCVF